MVCKAIISLLLYNLSPEKSINTQHIIFNIGICGSDVGKTICDMKQLPSWAKLNPLQLRYLNSLPRPTPTHQGIL